MCYLYVHAVLTSKSMCLLQMTVTQPSNGYKDCRCVQWILHYYCDVAILIAKNVNIHNEKEEELYLILSLYRLCNC